MSTEPARSSIAVHNRPMQWRLLKSWWQSRNRRRMGAHVVDGDVLFLALNLMPGGEWTIPAAELHQAGLRIEASPLVKIFFCNSRCATWIWKHGSFATAISSAPIGGWRRIAESSESALQQRWARHPNTICFVNRFGSPDSWIVTRINGFSQTASMLSVEPWEIGKYWQTHLNTYIWFMGSVSIPIERIYLVWDVLERLFLIAEENAHLSAHGALLHVDEDFILAYAFLGGKRFQHAPDGFRFFQDILDIDLPRILRKNQRIHIYEIEALETILYVFQYVSFLRISSGFHVSLLWIGQGEEVRMTLSEPNFATKLAATCAVDAESFPEALIFYFKIKVDVKQKLWMYRF